MYSYNKKQCDIDIRWSKYTCFNSGFFRRFTNDIMCDMAIIIVGINPPPIHSNQMYAISLRLSSDQVGRQLKGDFHLHI